jgi:branched-subunit amino acid transport protein
MIDRADFWIVTILLGLGTYAIRFSFLGMLGNRVLPLWLVRALRYTAVAIMPALVAPSVLWPAATNGTPDPARLLAAGATVLVGFLTRSMMAAIFAGGATLFAALWLFGA